MSYVIGIDGGGTKTKAVLADEHGTIYSEIVAGPSNLNSTSRDSVEKTFQDIFSHFKKTQPEIFRHVEFCFAGLSGIENEQNDAFTTAVFEQIIGGQFPYLIENDAVNALYSGTYGEPGIVQIAGTGSITFGIDRQLNKKRVGGWGYLFGDQGSGYAIGRDALQVVFQRYDRNEPESLLIEQLKDHFKVTGDLKEIVPLIYKVKSPRNVIANLSEVVFNAYDSGDKDAENIIRKAVKDLSDSIQTIASQFSSLKPQVVLVGGLFTRSDVLLPLLDEALKGEFPLILPKVEPVMGSVVAALREIGVCFSID